MKRFLLLLVVASTSALAAESDWQYATSSTSGSDYYIDTNSIKKVSPYSNDSVISVWVKTDHKRDKTVKHRQTKSLEEIDCNSMSARTTYIVLYGANGSVISSATAPTYERFLPLVPDSVGYAYADFACELIK